MTTTTTTTEHPPRSVEMPLPEWTAWIPSAFCFWVVACLITAWLSVWAARRHWHEDAMTTAFFVVVLGGPAVLALAAGIAFLPK